MELNEIKKNFDEIQTIVHNFKAENDEALKTNSAELNQKLDKMQEDMLNKAEENQKKIAELEAVANQVPVSEQEAEKNEKTTKAVVEFMRNAKNEETFNEFCKRADIELNALSVDSDPDGGYLVIPTIDRIRKTREFESTPIRQLANVMTINAGAIEIPVDYTEASASRTGERSSRSNTNTPTLGKIKIEAHELYANIAATQKLLDDASGMDIEAWIAGKVADKFSRTENTESISGTDELEFRGLGTYTAWTTNGTFEHGKLEQINSGNASALTADGLIDLQNSLIEIYQSNASWLTKRANFKAIMKLKTGDGEYLFNRNLDRNVGRPFDLLGRPVYFGNDVAAVAANALAIYYGDFNAGYQIVDRKGVTMLRDPFSNKPYVDFYFTKRSGGGVVNFEAIKIQKVSA